MARAAYESVLGPAGWGIRDTATGEVVVDGYDDAEDAWHAFMAEDDGIPIRERRHDSMTTDTDRERVIDARVQRRLATDHAYRNAENADDQARREDEITAEEEQRFGQPTVAEVIAGDIDQRAELLELADLAARFLAPAVVQATRRVERMTARPAGTHAQHKIDDARQELQEAQRAVDLARKHSPTRNAILEKFGAAAG